MNVSVYFNDASVTIYVQPAVDAAYSLMTYNFRRDVKMPQRLVSIVNKSERALWRAGMRWEIVLPNGDRSWHKTLQGCYEAHGRYTVGLWQATRDLEAQESAVDSKFDLTVLA